MTTIERLEKDKAQKQKELDELMALLGVAKKIPDLERCESRWNVVRYRSKTINKECDSFEWGYNCGCCHDSSLEIWPFTTIDGVKVFANPIPMIVGEKCGTGCKPYDGWEEQMRKNQISEALITKIRAFLETIPPEEYEDEPEDESQHLSE